VGGGRCGVEMSDPQRLEEAKKGDGHGSIFLVLKS